MWNMTINQGAANTNDNAAAVSHRVEYTEVCMEENDELSKWVDGMYVE
jgi:hypothetical protein